MTECPFCRYNEATVSSVNPELQLEQWDCMWCGRFVLKGAFRDPDTLRRAQGHLLRGIVMERSLRKEHPPVISHENVDALLTQAPQHPSEIADRLLLNLELKSSEPGVLTALTCNKHQGYAFVAGNDAFFAWLKFLERDGLIEVQGSRKDELNDLAFRLTLSGWRRAAELHKSADRSPVAFVAMPFRDEFTALWEQAIEPALRSTGWRGVRADKADHNERIDDWILNQIRASRMLVVETTGSNPGACFEAGFALGLGKPVIWMIRKGSLGGLHFDIRQFNHLEWEAGKEGVFSKKLANRIQNTIGLGPRESGLA